MIEMCAELADTLRAQGFVVVPARVPEAVARECSAALQATWEACGEPALYARDDVRHQEDVVVSPVGFTLSEILSHAPSLAEVLVDPALLSLFHELLGPKLELEMGAAIRSDHTRPFFFWHNHLGGIDGEDYRHAETLPQPTQAERIACTLYLSPLDEDHGTMLLRPRGYLDPPAHPAGDIQMPWPGAVELRVEVGSVLVLDQSTWHAVTPMKVAGTREFAGFFIRRRGVTAVREDPSIRPALHANPRLRAAYG